MSYIVDRLFVAVRAQMYLPYVKSPHFYSIATAREKCHFSPCASHFSMNQFAVGLGSGNLCSTLLQGAEALPAIYLIKYSFDFSPILRHCQSLVRSNGFSLFPIYFCFMCRLYSSSFFFLLLPPVLSPQCCRRKLVAMLMSLFEALRASRASTLEKPISTNRATCGKLHF